MGTDLVNRFVYVVDKNNRAEYRIVRVGECVGNMQIIEEGLTADDRVIVNGLQRAVAGKEVSPVMKGIKEAGK